jgi:hypothetical protein
MIAGGDRFHALLAALAAGHVTTEKQDNDARSRPGRCGVHDAGWMRER